MTYIACDGRTGCSMPRQLLDFGSCCKDDFQANPENSL